jgi:secreted trypsin-like serine protease
MTAAHCCDGYFPSDLTVVAAELVFSEDDGREQRIEVAEIRGHTGFDWNTLVNDVCILKLATPIELIDGQTETVTLPEPHEETSGQVIASGWGGTDPLDPFNLPDHMQWVELPVVSDDDCREAYADYHPYDDTMICAGGAQGICKGDSGGPLVVVGTKKVVGVTSWGHYGCADPIYPGVFTQVSHFLDWIAEHSQ